MDAFKLKEKVDEVLKNSNIDDEFKRKIDSFVFNNQPVKGGNNPRSRELGVLLYSFLKNLKRLAFLEHRDHTVNRFIKEVNKKTTLIKFEWDYNVLFGCRTCNTKKLSMFTHTKNKCSINTTPLDILNNTEETKEEFLLAKKIFEEKKRESAKTLKNREEVIRKLARIALLLKLTP